ncbi:MAG: class B sortase [Oscillospiraceae bacterium]|nr:class B sortase [Oscillospiraceae bacterium]
MKKENNTPKRRRSMVVPVLSFVALALVGLIVFMLMNLPEEKPAPVETAAPTTAATQMTTEATSEATTEPTVAPTVDIEKVPEMLEHMAELYMENPDTIGYVKIADTKLDYPVMFTPDDEEKYIRKDFKGRFSIAGLPFMNEDCSLDPRSDNIIIYGHNMYDGTAFRTLLKYDQKPFWEKHPTFTFSTLYEEKEYEIISCFYDRVYLKTENVFKFYKFINAEDEEDFDYAIEQFKKKSLYDTGVTAEYGDNLVTLVTCAYHVDNGRFVVVGKEIKDQAE